MKRLFLFLYFSLAEKWISRSVEFDDFAKVTWSFNSDDAKNPDSPIRFEINTKLSQFSFGWNRYVKKQIRMDSLEPNRGGNG